MATLPTSGGGHTQNQTHQVYYTEGGNQFRTVEPPQVSTSPNMAPMRNNANTNNTNQQPRSTKHHMGMMGNMMVDDLTSVSTIDHPNYGRGPRGVMGKSTTSALSSVRQHVGGTGPKLGP